MIWNIVFLCLALLGAILSFGPSVLDAILAGVAGIDFVSPMDAIVFGILMAILVALCGFCLSTLKGKKEVIRPVRVVCWSVVGVVLMAYAVLVCSIWADGWLTGYRAWMEASADALRIACYAGWLCIVCSGGWLARAIYECFFKVEKARVSDSGN